MKKIYVCTCYKNPETGDIKTLVEDYELGTPVYKELFSGFDVVDMRVVTEPAINNVLDMFVKKYNTMYKD